jgi:hypothetical protein
MKYKQDYAVLDHNAKLVMTGTARKCCEALGIKIKSFFNANYVDKSIQGYVILKQEQLKEFDKLSDIMTYCRSLDRRWVDTLYTPKTDIPIYRTHKRDCVRTYISAKDIERFFTEQQIIDAEKQYRKNEKNDK